MITLGSYARVQNTKTLVQVISTPYEQHNTLFVDVRLVSDPIITFTIQINDLEEVPELA